jgi:hypothetical protein
MYPMGQGLRLEDSEIGTETDCVLIVGDPVTLSGVPFTFLAALK